MFVVGTVGRQLLARGVEGFAEAGDIAVPEDRPYATQQRLDAVAGPDFLGGQVAYQRLGYRESDCGHAISLSNGLGSARPDSPPGRQAPHITLRTITRFVQKCKQIFVYFSK